MTNLYLDLNRQLLPMEGLSHLFAVKVILCFGRIKEDPPTAKYTLLKYSYQLFCYINRGKNSFVWINNLGAGQRLVVKATNKNEELGPPFPDIIVENKLDSIPTGKDQQLKVAAAELLKQVDQTCCRHRLQLNPQKGEKKIPQAHQCACEGYNSRIIEAAIHGNIYLVKHCSNRGPDRNNTNSFCIPVAVPLLKTW